MEYYLDRLKNELSSILEFWLKHVISDSNVGLYSECSNSGQCINDKTVSSIYLSKLMYGASAACRFFDTNKYKHLADRAFKILYERLRNPAGAFYYAKDSKNNVIHNADEINSAQAFAIIGLLEYAQLTNNPIVESEINKLKVFVTKHIFNPNENAYLDGFSQDWKQEKTFTKSFNTHIYFLEAFIKLYHYSADKTLVPSIENLCLILSENFIDNQNSSCIQRLSLNNQSLSDEYLCGQNAQAGFILCKASIIIKNDKLYSGYSDLLLRLTEKITNDGFDKSYGGVSDLMGKSKLYDKTWWVQSVSALAFL